LATRREKTSASPSTSQRNSPAAPATRKKASQRVLSMACSGPLEGGLVGAARALDEFDLVAVGVFHKRNDRGAVLHGAGFAHHLATFLANAVTGGVGVVHFQGNVAVAVAQIVAVGVPVVGQFNDG